MGEAFLARSARVGGAHPPVVRGDTPQWWGVLQDAGVFGNLCVV